VSLLLRVLLLVLLLHRHRRGTGAAVALRRRRADQRGLFVYRLVGWLRGKSAVSGWHLQANIQPPTASINPLGKKQQLATNAPALSRGSGNEATRAAPSDKRRPPTKSATLPPNPGWRRSSARSSATVADSATSTVASRPVSVRTRTRCILRERGKREKFLIKRTQGRCVYVVEAVIYYSSRNLVALRPCPENHQTIPFIVGGPNPKSTKSIRLIDRLTVPQCRPMHAQSIPITSRS